MLFYRSTYLRALGASLVLLTAACADEITTAASTPTALSRISASPALSIESHKHLVHFTGDDIPASFSARITALGGTVDAAYDGVGIAVVDGLTPEAATQLAGDAGISAVDPDNVFQFIDSPAGNATADATDVVIASPSDPATAAFFSRQWNMRAIGADAAWAAGHRGSAAVKVAIVDTGIDYLHPDLAGRVDLANSASFVPSDDALVSAAFPGRHVVTDLHFHGTHVAAAVSSNAFLVAGVSSMTTLMGVKVVGAGGTGTTSALLAGIVFATDHGANVINISLGPRDLLSRKEKEVKDFQRTTDRVYGYAHKKGVTVIVAAGNERQDLDAKQTFKPWCGSTHVICVSATGPTSQAGIDGPWTNIDAPASYSNFGVKDVDIAAPGGNGASVVWGPCSTSSLVIPVCQTALLPLGFQGTSLAAPHASGAAALLLAQHGSLQPGQVQAILENSADDLGAKGKDPFYGRGRINVRKALGL